MDISEESCKMLEPIFLKNNSEIDPYEDYAYVIDECEKYGVKQIQVDDYCEGCDEDVEDITINIPSYRWKCPKCGYVNNEDY